MATKFITGIHVTWNIDDNRQGEMFISLSSDKFVIVDNVGSEGNVIGHKLVLDKSISLRNRRSEFDISADEVQRIVKLINEEG